jgi:hypothetical protein
MFKKHVTNVQEIAKRDAKANDGAKASEIGVKKQLKKIQKVTAEDTRSK